MSARSYVRACTAQSVLPVNDACVPGQFYNESERVCVACPDRTYAPDGGFTHCLTCLPGNMVINRTYCIPNTTTPAPTPSPETAAPTPAPTTPCAGRPCFPGVQCMDVARAPGGFVCGLCPPAFVGNGVNCSAPSGFRCPPLDMDVLCASACPGGCSPQGVCWVRGAGLAGPGVCEEPAFVEARLAVVLDDAASLAGFATGLQSDVARALGVSSRRLMVSSAVRVESGASVFAVTFLPDPPAVAASELAGQLTALLRSRNFSMFTDAHAALLLPEHFCGAVDCHYGHCTDTVSGAVCTCSNVLLEPADCRPGTFVWLVACTATQVCSCCLFIAQVPGWSHWSRRWLAPPWWAWR